MFRSGVAHIDVTKSYVFTANTDRDISTAAAIGVMPEKDARSPTEQALFGEKCVEFPEVQNTI